MKRILPALAIIFLTGNIFAQATFHKNIFPGESYVSTMSSNLSNFFVAVSTADSGLYVVKYDNSGVMQWSKKINEPLARTISVIQSSADGGCFIGGNFGGGILLDSCYIAKLDVSGGLVWLKNINYRLSVSSIRPTNRVSGITEGVLAQDIVVLTNYWESNGSNGTGATFDYLTKLNQNGDVQWSRKYPPQSGNEDYFTSIIEAENNNYLLEGKLWSGGNWVLKIDDDGNPLWSKFYLTLMTGQGGDRPIGIYYDAGNSRYNMITSGDYNGRFLITQLNTSGVKTAASIYNSTDQFKIQTSHETNDGGLLLGGYFSYNSQLEFPIIKVVNDFSTVSWGKSIYEPKLSSVGVTGFGDAASGGYFIAGDFDTSSSYYYTKLSGYLAKTDASGNGDFCNSHSLASIVKTSATFTDGIYPLSDSSSIASDLSINTLSSGTTSGYYGEATVQCSTGVNDVNEAEDILSVYPNPSDGKIQIKRRNGESVKVRIINMLGETVYQTILSDNQSTIDISNQPTGTYFLLLQTKYEIISRKIVKKNVDH